MKEISLMSILVAGSFSFGCSGSGRDYPVVLVDRNVTFTSDEELDPLRLVIEINEEGKLRLNKIETGTTADLAELTEKITVVFDDRLITGIERRDVVIDPKGNVQNAELEKLIRSLADANASSIRVIQK